MSEPEEGLLTFRAEGLNVPDSFWYSRKVPWPGKRNECQKWKSGVTMGRGYDLGNPGQNIKDVRIDMKYQGGLIREMIWKSCTSLFYFFSCLVLLRGNKQSIKKKISPTKNATVEACYSLDMSAAIVNCMGSLAGESEDQYNKEYRNFVARNAKNKKGFNNYAEFIKEAEKAKKIWDAYVKHECLAAAYIAIKGSWAFDIYNNECLQKRYSERARLYEKYQGY